MGMVDTFHVKHFGKRAQIGNRSTWNKAALCPEWAWSQIGKPPIIAHFRHNSALKIQKFSTVQRNSDLRIAGEVHARKFLSCMDLTTFCLLEHKGLSTAWPGSPQRKRLSSNPASL